MTDEIVRGAASAIARLPYLRSTTDAGKTRAMAGYYDHFEWRPYVSVAERHRLGARAIAALEKKGLVAKPVDIDGRTIARSFWGKAWCDNLERYSDFSNRLPRGRTYVRNGSVRHLDVAAGEVTAYVSGQSLYEVRVRIAALSRPRWRALVDECGSSIGSVVELLAGKLSSRVMEVVSAEGTGLFPPPREIEMSCSCPDWAVMCKHVAATLYGVGARLDDDPRLLFVLRQVDESELIRAASGISTGKPSARALDGAVDLGAVFGIDLDGDALPPANSRTERKSAAKEPSPRASSRAPPRTKPAKKEPAQQAPAKAKGRAPSAPAKKAPASATKRKTSRGPVEDAIERAIERALAKAVPSPRRR